MDCGTTVQRSEVSEVSLALPGRSMPERTSIRSIQTVVTHQVNKCGRMLFEHEYNNMILCPSAMSV